MMKPTRHSSLSANFVQIGILTILICLILAPSPIWAQSTAEISGLVTDQSGAVLPGVMVTATQTGTGLARNSVTDETGRYTLPDLPIGPYRLDAMLPGFRSFARTGIVLQVGSNPVINVVLEVGQVSETVEVQADAALVETRNTGVSQVMDNTRVLELPLNGRQVTDLISLSGAATVSATKSQDRGYPTVYISVAGGLANGLTYLLDGATHNDPFNTLNLPLPFPDALQEFKLETSSLSAQYGQHSAGAVNAVTKSGTNDIHGDVFEFVRNGSLNARNAFALKRDSLKRNQYGGTVGGPVIKNKLFFFGGYQGTNLRTAPTNNFGYIPTDAMMAGDWTAITSPACNGGRQIPLKAPFLNNRIDPALFSIPAVNIVKNALFPRTTDPCGQVLFGLRQNSNEHIVIGRVDYQRNEKHTVFGRYEIAHEVNPAGYDGKNLLTATSVGLTRPEDIGWQTQSFVLGDTYLIGSGIVNSFRATLLRPTGFRKQPFGELSPDDVGIKNLWHPDGYARVTSIAVSGEFSFGGATATPSYTNSTAFQFVEDVSWVRGAHQIGFGGNYIHSYFNSLAATNTPGHFTFSAANTGLGLGDFMLGKITNLLQAGVGTFYPRGNYVGLYVQDTWKANSRLTVNGGLRWDPFLPISFKDKALFHFNQSWFDQGIRSTVYKNAPAGVLYPGDPGVPNTGSVGPNLWGKFGPRLGLALDPKGDGRMTIRSSYGMFFDYPEFFKFQSIENSPPWTNTLNLTNPSGTLADPWQGYPGGNPFPIVVGPNVAYPLGGAYVNRPLNLKSTYVNQWNFSAQKQIGADWLVSANYIGDSIIHLLNTSEGNPAVYLPGASCVINGKTYSPCSSTSNTIQRRKLYLQNPDQGQYYGNIINMDDGGTSSYNALLMTLQHRTSKGLTVQANYTWSHCITTGTSMLFQNAGGAIPERRRANRGNCTGLEVDLRHNFNLSTVYATPQFSNAKLRTLGTGWQVSAIAKIQSGGYLTIASGLDNALSATQDERPNQVLASPYAAQKSTALWLNPAAFAQPAIGTYGSMGAGNVLGPGFIGIDMGLARKFQVREKQSIEFRAEAFNMPNHMNPGNPNTTLTSNTFGVIQSAADPRVLQLALKYIF